MRIGRPNGSGNKVFPNFNTMYLRKRDVYRKKYPDQEVQEDDRESLQEILLKLLRNPANHFKGFISLIPVLMFLIRIYQGKITCF